MKQSALRQIEMPFVSFDESKKHPFTTYSSSNKVHLQSDGGIVQNKK